MYFPVLLWSLVIFASFWGYGEALRRALKRPEFDDLGWGLTAAWGMAVTLAIGGFLMMLSLAKAPMLIAQILIGFGFFAYFLTYRNKQKPSKQTTKTKHPSTPLAGEFAVADLILWVLAGLAFASAIAWPHQIDPNDDLICYLVFPERILQTGTLLEPFSFRRILTFGGQSFLQALVLIPGFERNAHVPDRGFAELVLLGVIFGILKKHPRTALVLMVSCLVLLVPMPRINTAGAFTGGILLMALILTFEKTKGIPNLSFTAFLPAALMAAAACTIRPTFLFAAALVSLLEIYFPKQNEWSGALGSYFKTRLRETAIFGFATFAALASWMIMLYISSGTPLCPPFGGNFNPEFQIQDYPGEFFRNIATAVEYVFSIEMLPLFLGILAGGILAGGRSILLAGIAVLITSLVLVFMQASLMKQEFYRYLFPVVFPVAVLALLRFSIQEKDEPETLRKSTARVFAVLSILGIGMVQLTPGLNEVLAEFESLPLQTAEERGFLPDQYSKIYNELQLQVPTGKTIYAIVDAPYLLNFRRNPIFVADVLGGASPKNEMPLLQGTSALLNYFKKMGIEYVLAVDFDNALLLYTRKHWLEHKRPEWFYKQVWGKHALDFMDRIDEIAKTNTIATSGNVRLLKIPNLN